MGTDIREEDKQMCNAQRSERQGGGKKKRMEERRTGDRLINAGCGGGGGWGRGMVG